MPQNYYDAVVVGGGMGGSAFAGVMARAGYRVLVVEREMHFRDRVRGEGMHAWGIPEAKALGIYDTLLEHCAVEAPWWDIYLSGQPMMHRNFPATTPHASPLLAFPHPAMQEALLELAEASGADIARGARVRAVRGGIAPAVTVDHGDWVSEINARLVVGADGRNSPTRRWGQFEVRQDPAERLFTGVLLGGIDLSEDTWLAYMNPDNGLEAMLCAIGDGHVRAYLGHTRAAGLRIRKAEDLPAFIGACMEAGAPRSLYEKARVDGPMASFGTEDTWVGRPYRDGIALIGDAASTCDPTFGQGMALTLRSVRLLCDRLLAHDDWQFACNDYAVEQHRQFETIRTIENWYRDLFLRPGDEAEQRRAKALPRLAEEPSRDPDLFGLGPDAPCDDMARRRLYGEI